MELHLAIHKGVEIHRVLMLYLDVYINVFVYLCYSDNDLIHLLATNVVCFYCETQQSLFTNFKITK